MPIQATTKNEIIRRFYSGQSMRQIATELQVSRKSVRRVLDEHDQQRQSDGADTGELPPRRPRRGSLVDAYEELIRELLGRYPDITCTRLLQELQAAGYTGSYTILRERVNVLRPRPDAKLVQRFETGLGAQAQMDYATYTIEFTQEGRRRVHLFSYLLGYSRRQYLHFVESQDSETTIREHVRAFEYLGGAAATCLYDNMKVVVLRHEEGVAVYNPKFLAFATHYGFRPIACAPRRPQTKGKVERPFHYVEVSLLNARTFRSLEHLNEVTAWWLKEVADQRIHPRTQQSPRERHAAEQPHLIPLPEQPYEVADVVYRVVDVEGLISYARNRYSVPWRQAHPGQTLPVKITEDEVIIYGPQVEELARHRRFPRNVRHKESREKQHYPPRDHTKRREVLREQFGTLGETAMRFLEGLLKTQRNGWHHAQQILTLLGTWHRSDLLAAFERAVTYGAFSRDAIERILAARARPKTPLDQLAESSQRHLRYSWSENPTPLRPTSAYQQLLFEDDPTDEETPEQPTETETQQVEETDNADTETRDEEQRPPSEPA